MIIAEQLNERLVRHYSDNGVYLRQLQTGIEYSEAVDIIPCCYEYIETDKPIEQEQEEVEE